MKILKLKRTFFEGWKNFVRNGWLSFATSSIMVLSLYVMSVTVIFGIVGNIFVRNGEKNISISVYFNPKTPSEQIQELKSQLEKADEIFSVRYVSENEALDQLMQSEKDNPIIKRSLEAVGSNPLPASLIIRAKDISLYEKIEVQLSQSKYADIISHINYKKNREMIEQFRRFIVATQKIGLAIGLVFMLIAVLVTYNTVRLTLYSHKQEFEIMRLVGASNLYIKMPVLFEGVFYGVFASVFTVILLFLSIQFFAPITRFAAMEENLVSFFTGYFWIIFLVLLFSGMCMGVLSGWIAIKRYLKV